MKKIRLEPDEVEDWFRIVGDEETEDDDDLSAIYGFLGLGFNGRENKKNLLCIVTGVPSEYEKFFRSFNCLRFNQKITDIVFFENTTGNILDK